MENNKRIIEINGIKLEVDMREAVKIENFKVGDTVKLLIKEYSDYKSHIGVIVGFDSFKERPTIIIAYLLIEYSTCTIKFAYINKESKDIEICLLNEWDIPFTKVDMMNKFQLEINKKEEELRDILTRRDIFEKHFGKYFQQKTSEDKNV